MRPDMPCLAQFKPDNAYTRRYNPGTPGGEVLVPADWISGSCFLARRDAFEELGGFDEAYFMYLEDTDLCWRAHHAGWGVGFAGTAAVTHVQGVSTARHPYRMLAAHHRSALRFTVRTTSGWRARRPAVCGHGSRRSHGAWRWCVRPSPAEHAANRGWLIAALAVIRVALLVLVLAATLSGPVPPKVHVEPEVTFALPSTSAGCGGDTTRPTG